MKKLLAVIFLALGISGNAQAISVLGDLIAYTNYSATFTKVVDVGELTSFSLQVVGSTVTQPTTTLADSSKVDLAADTIISSAAYGLGQQVLFSTGTPIGGVTGVMPTGLTAGTTYFMIPRTDITFAMALTSTGAIAGLAIDLTAVSTSTVVTMAPLTLAMGATAGASWEASNDGTNFNVYGTSVTMTTVGTGTQLRDFGAFPYKFLRMSILGVTAGTMRMRIFINGRRAG